MRRHISILILIVSSSLLWAMSNTRVSEQEAQAMAAEYYQIINEGDDLTPKIGHPELVSLLGIADMWLVPVDSSWILVSSDKRVEAILARISSSEKPDLKLYPPPAQYLISCYEHNIAFVRDSCKECPILECWKHNGLRKKKQREEQLASYPSSVAPLLGDLAWEQSRNGSLAPICDYTYNKFCPPITTNDPTLCGKAVLGCVAVAIGQIMWYWKWPYVAQVPTTVGGSIKETHFYDWDLMPPQLYNSTSMGQVNMVAGFLRDCGYDLDMSYGESSSASINDAKRTLTNFGYDKNSIKIRSKLTTSGWTNLLHEEIAAGRPVYYRGQTLSGAGHAFVLDGYDTYGLYHANIGWGSFYNDYYFIDTITVGGGRYSYLQKAIFGIQPSIDGYCTGLTFTSNMSTMLSNTWGVARAGAIVFDGVVMNSNTNCRVYSSTSILLSPGTEVRSGATALFAIKDVPCSSPSNINSVSNNDKEGYYTENAISILPEQIIVSPNPAKDVLKIQYDGTLKDVFIYNALGKVVYHGCETLIPVYSLPDGVYILCVRTDDGDILQTKFLHQQ